MLSLDLLYAVLQGLPASHLKHLDRPWMMLCERIERALKGGQSAVSAIRLALEETHESHIGALRRALSHVADVRRLKKLSYRQKELLIALRVAKVGSLRQLCSAVTQDRSNAFRRLEFLVRQGYALKFYKPGGVEYMAVEMPLSRHVRSELNRFILELITEIESKSDPL